MPEITKISHGLTIGDLKYGNARPGVVEATLKPGETLEQALDELDDRLNAWHKARYPHLYQEEYPKPYDGRDRFQHMTSGQLPPTQVEFAGALPIISKDNERMEIEIDNCTSEEDLKQWKENNPVIPVPILKHYNQKLKELTNNG